MNIYLPSDMAALWDTLSYPWVSVWKGLFGRTGGWAIPLFLYGLLFIGLGLPVLLRCRYPGKGWYGWIGLLLGAVRWVCPVIWLWAVLPLQTKPAQRSVRYASLWLLGVPLGVLSWAVRSEGAFAAQGHPDYLLQVPTEIWLLSTVIAVIWALIVAVRGRLRVLDGALLVALCAVAPDFGPVLTLRELFSGSQAIPQAPAHQPLPEPAPPVPDSGTEQTSAHLLRRVHRLFGKVRPS